MDPYNRWRKVAAELEPPEPDARVDRPTSAGLIPRLDGPVLLFAPGAHPLGKVTVDTTPRLAAIGAYALP